MPKMILDVKLYSLKEAADLMGVCYATVNKYIKDGRLRSTLIGGQKMVTEENLKKFLNDSK